MLSGTLSDSDGLPCALLYAKITANHQHLIETENLSPNIPDPNSYTPMHAAASYAHTNLLEYLISKGGDINLRDDDGDTPLYVVESVEMARWMIERGADWGVVNEEGLSVSLISVIPGSSIECFGRGCRAGRRAVGPEV